MSTGHTLAEQAISRVQPEAQHTQGEWNAVIYGGWDAPRIWGPTGSIAILQHHDSGPAEAEANARLMAASPKLLTACRAWLDDDVDDGEFADTLRKIIATTTKPL